MLTCGRMLCGLCLFFCPMFSVRFWILYLLGGVTDVLDGMIARKLGTESSFGARLDTAADLLYWGAVLIGLVRTISLPRWIAVWVIGIALVKCVSLSAGRILHGRFLAEHTVLNKLCGILLFLLPACVCFFPRRAAEGWMILTCAAATVAAVQEAAAVWRGKEIR